MCSANRFVLGALVVLSTAAGSLAEDKPRIATDLVLASRHDGGEKILRISGKVKVVDAGTLAFEDGTEVFVAGPIDAPALKQKALIGDRFYPWGEEAADYLRKVIGDQSVTFYAFGEGKGKAGQKINGICFVGETNLGVEMVRNGWALSGHSTMVPYEIIAREKKRGAWRGQFIAPERWRKGDRLLGE